jgi:mono/diheme cytochrome c family protein
MRDRVLLAGALVALASVAVAPLAGRAGQERASTAPADRATLERGEAVYDEWCAACHDPGPRHPGTQALEALYKGTRPAALEERTDLTPAITATFVRQGVSVMAPFRKTEISDEDLAALAAYLAPRP